MGDRDPPGAVVEYADTLGARLWRAGIDFECVRHDDERWDYRGRCSTIAGLPRPSLPGQVQYDNAAACLAAIEAMQSALPVASDAIAAALQSVRLSGRLERAWIGAAEWVFDVAHNPAAAALLAQELTDRPAIGRTFAIVGLMADKDISGVLRPFAGVVDEWLATQAETERAAEPQALISALEALEALGGGAARPVDNAVLAGEIAAAEAQPGDRIVVFGSFQIVGPVMAALKL
jgi:dihydrofolate synthase/folylpolyglutamate synthase